MSDLGFNDEWILQQLGESQLVVKKNPLQSFQNRMEHIRIESVDGELQKELFLRVYRGQFSWWTLEADLPSRELAARSFCERNDLRVPEVIQAGTEPLPFTLSLKAEGISLREICTKESTKHLARYLAKLHTSAFSEDEKRTLPDASLNSFLPRLEEWSKSTEDDLVMALTLQIMEEAESVAEKTSFVHGDCNQGNFLFSENSGITMLDFEESCIGDPRIDIANIHNHLHGTRSPQVAEFFLHEYESATGWKVGPMDFWVHLINIRDIVTAKYLENRVQKNLNIPRFDPRNWIRYGNELIEKYRR